jgi:thymidine kinase
MRHTHGSIEVVCGSMFSGKTDELIRRLVRATIARQKVQVFKPAIDVRYAVEKVTSHAGSDFDATPVEKSVDILSKIAQDTTVVGIDEAQFFDPEIVQIAEQLSSRHPCPVAGLDTDFRREPLAHAILMSVAERVDKLHAICMVCVMKPRAHRDWLNGKPARYDDPIVIVGASECMARGCGCITKCPDKV